MVRPAVRRTWVAWVREMFRVSTSRACRATGVHRSLITRRLRRPRQDALRQRLRELAAARVSYGYPRLHVLLRREGWPVNRKRVYRLYREEGLMLKRRRPTRRKSAARRVSRPVAQQPNERWAMDFVHDRLHGGQTVRILTVVDVCTRECLVLHAARQFRGEDVVAALTRVCAARGKPPVIQVDNGTKFTSRALDARAYWNSVTLDFSRPGKPTDNAVIEAFNGTLRRECLSQHWFLSLEETQHQLDHYRHEYNFDRPHSSLANHPPARLPHGGHYLPSPTRLLNSHSTLT